jgi:hypothetical protein
VTEFITVVNDPALTVASVKLGRKETWANRTYPSVVFVPLGGPIVPPDRVGAGKIDPDTRSKILLVRNCQILVECHGQNWGQCEDLLHECTRAVRNILHNSVEISDELWPSQEPDSDGFDKDGELVTFTFTWQIPIYDIDRALTVVTEIVDGDDTFGDEVIPCNPGT